MKINRIILLAFISIVLFSPFIGSCKKAEQSKKYSYFVSKDFVNEYTTAYITNLLEIVSGPLPEIGPVKALIKSDVNIYKIVYKTTVKGNVINASGLICVPVTPGDYPVLSFQNGTNTVNADAPSEFPADYNYQLVEIMASLGYIVVIADYPGFGESAQIPHPYLVAEPTVRSLVDMLYTVKERTKEIGTLKAIGFSNSTVMGQFMLEGILLSIIAGVVGIAIGSVAAPTLSALLLPSVGIGSRTAGVLSGTTRVSGLSVATLNPELILILFGAAVLLGTLGSLYPAWRAAKIRPAEAMKYE